MLDLIFSSPTRDESYYLTLIESSTLTDMLCLVILWVASKFNTTMCSEGTESCDELQLLSFKIITTTS